MEVTLTSSLPCWFEVLQIEAFFGKFLIEAKSPYEKSLDCNISFNLGPKVASKSVLLPWTLILEQVSELDALAMRKK